MKTMYFNIILFVFGISVSPNLLGQDINNQLVVKKIYDVLQDKSATSQDLEVLFPVEKWGQIRNSINENEKYSISLNGIIEGDWGSIVFEKIQFQTPAENEVVVTGMVRGRQPTECKYISRQFEHYWFFKGGVIVGFRE